VEGERTSEALLRILGLTFGIAVVVGGTVGQGILRTPGLVAHALPSAPLIMAVWIAGGLLALIDACAMMELAAAVPRAGGPYAFARRAFGPFAGTMLGCNDSLNGIVTNAFIAVVFGEYLQRLGIGTAFPVNLLAVTLLATTFAINWIGTRESGVSQAIGSALKGIALLLLVAVLMTAGEPSRTAQGPLPPVLGIAAIGLAVRAVIVTYAGWNASVYFCEELHQPERNVVRSTIWGILIVTTLYVLVNVSLLHVLTPAEIAASNLPAADALARAIGPQGGLIVTAIAVISVAAIANLQTMLLPRTIFAMARDGALPRGLARVADRGTPRRAMLITSLSATLLAGAGGYETLIAMGAALVIVNTAVVDLAAISLRRTEPDLRRPFRMPLFPVPALLGLAINGLLLVAVFIEDPIHSSTGFAILLAIAAVYKLARRARPTPPSAEQI